MGKCFGRQKPSTFAYQFRVIVKYLKIKGHHPPVLINGALHVLISV